MFESTERPGIQEQYATAMNTSDLTVEADRRGAADIIIAAGTSHSRLSHAMAALRGEWDRTAKTPKMTEDQIHSLAESYPKKGKPDLNRARAEALVWHARQLREQAKRLPSRSAVLDCLRVWMAAKGIDHDLAWMSVYHLLNPNCPACDGLGKRRAPDAPVLMAQCKYCGGSGYWPEPQGASRIKAHLQYIENTADGSMRRKLRNGG